MVRAARLMSIPIIVTEQYPKAFGSTVAELQEFLLSESNPDGAPVYTKKQFSMITREVVAAHRQLLLIPGMTAVIVGIEAHVCVQQTVLHLLNEDISVSVVVDGVSSQRAGDRAVALSQMARAGAALTTTESAILSLCGSADATNFKAISSLLKEHNSAGWSQLV